MTSATGETTATTLTSPDIKWRWLFGWTAKFTESWGSLPATPIIYFGLLLGTINVILRDPTPGNAGDVIAQPWASLMWRILSVISPLLAFLSGYLIVNFHGVKRLFGLWLRLAGDLGQFVALATFLLGRIAAGPISEARLYVIYGLSGVLVYVGMLAVRDIWILIQVEEITRELERQDRLTDGNVGI